MNTEPEIKKRFIVAKIGIFGSFVREEERPESYVDVLRTFRKWEDTWFVGIFPRKILKNFHGNVSGIPHHPPPFRSSEDPKPRSPAIRKPPLSFPILCSCWPQKDFRLPIACISPDFGSRRGKSNPGPIRREKSPHCTVFPQFPGFQVHRIFLSFSNSPKWTPFNKRSPIYNIIPLPNLYSPDRCSLRRRPSVDRQIRGSLVGGGIPALSPQIPVSPAWIPDHRIFRSGPW